MTDTCQAISFWDWGSGFPGIGSAYRDSIEPGLLGSSAHLSKKARMFPERPEPPKDDLCKLLALDNTIIVIIAVIG